jgi:hypothetical protein
MQTCVSLIDFSQSSMFFDLSFQFVILHLLISVCTHFHHPYFGRPLSRLLWGLLLSNWFTFLLLFILFTRPIQFDLLLMTNESISKSPSSCLNSLIRYIVTFNYCRQNSLVDRATEWSKSFVMSRPFRSLFSTAARSAPLRPIDLDRPDSGRLKILELFLLGSHIWKQMYGEDKRKAVIQTGQNSILQSPPQSPCQVHRTLKIRWFIYIYIINIWGIMPRKGWCNFPSTTLNKKNK